MAHAYSDHHGVIVEVLRQRLDKIARKHVTCPRQPLSIRWNPIGGGAEDEAPMQPLKKRRSEPSSGTL
ncbi:hypothetical protein DRW03_32825 [Corallococcus sp. H22C18031201]|nr:hypothetical protein DRW03_32825 [Corallococcus sp. H22C18031201]